jgi:hypothetical protein
MLLLPMGEVLFASGTADIEIYEPDGMHDPAWQLKITNCPASLKVNQTYTLNGIQ